MSPALPRPIAAYFAADTTDAAAVAACFTDDAVVTDERETHQGRAAIARWKAATTAKYAYTSTPTAIAHTGDRVIVTAHLTGSFPGSPIDLRYAFTLEGDAIARLEIAP